MRRPALVVMCIALLVGHASAQDVLLRMGASVGSPVPFGNIPDGASGSPVIGLIAGGGLRLPIDGPWSVFAEVQLARYGSRFTTPLDQQPFMDKVEVRGVDGNVVVYDVETTFTGTATGRFDNQYLQVPVLIGLAVSDRWDALFGPYVAWLVSTGTTARGVGRVGIRPEVVEKDMTFGDRMSKYDAGLQAGAQWAMMDDLVVDARLTLGLRSVFDPSFRTVQYPVQNLFLHLGAGLRL
jgi:hypothetical protein